MKARLEFNLPEEQIEYNTCMKAADVLGALRDYRDWLRAQRKYQDLEDKARDFADIAWDELFSILQVYGLTDIIA